MGGSQMLAAASGGHGSYSGGGGSSSCFTIDICPDLLIAAIAAAAAGAFYLIYTGITKASAKRRKRSSMPFDDALIDPITFVSEHVTDILFSGESIDSQIHNCILSSLNFFFIQ